jgi:tetratricopeptide (TPR) repeat protein
MYDLKKLSRDAIPAAMEKVERYRLLNEPWEAESICRDIVERDPDNQEALVQLLLAITDQFKTESGGHRVKEAREVLERLKGAYERAYYGGIIWERRGTALLARHGVGSGPLIYGRLREAMVCYQRAEELSPPGNESALLRWNTCARLIMDHPEIAPVDEPDFEPLLE